MHWFQVTVFAGLEAVQELVERFWSGDEGRDDVTWAEKGAVGRWENILVGPFGVELCKPKFAREMYTHVYVRGASCEVLGGERLLALLRMCEDLGLRWKGKRVDLAFDGVPFTPSQVYQAIKSGNIRSVYGRDDAGWRENAEGTTAYLPELRQSGRVKLLRVYDRRGPVRCELELRDVEAHVVIGSLMSSAVQTWPEVAKGHLLRLVDFIGRAPGARTRSCARLPWWSDFLGASVKASLPVATPATITALGRANVRVQRMARTLWPMVDAFGIQWILAQVERCVSGKLRPEDLAFRDELKRWRGFLDLDGKMGAECPF